MIFFRIQWIYYFFFKRRIMNPFLYKKIVVLTKKILFDIKKIIYTIEKLSKKKEKIL